MDEGGDDDWGGDVNLEERFREHARLDDEINSEWYLLTGCSQISRRSQISLGPPQRPCGGDEESQTGNGDELESANNRDGIQRFPKSSNTTNNGMQTSQRGLENRRASTKSTLSCLYYGRSKIAGATLPPCGGNEELQIARSGGMRISGMRCFLENRSTWLTINYVTMGCWDLNTPPSIRQISSTC